MAENVPILQIVGCAARPLAAMASSENVILHHTMALDSFESHARMSRPATCSEALLSSMPEEDWTEAFEEVLKEVLVQCKPGYIQVPTDAWSAEVSTKGLATKLVGI